MSIEKLIDVHVALDRANALLEHTSHWSTTTVTQAIQSWTQTNFILQLVVIVLVNVLYNNRTSLSDTEFVSGLVLMLICTMISVARIGYSKGLKSNGP